MKTFQTYLGINGFQSVGRLRSLVSGSIVKQMVVGSSPPLAVKHFFKDFFEVESERPRHSVSLRDVLPVDRHWVCQTSLTVSQA